MIIKLLFLLTVSWIQVARARVLCDDIPDFSAPGRRISDQKCHEYNWIRKNLKKCSSAYVETEPNEYPYMGALAYTKEDKKNNFLCVSFLISPKFAVTTAHCVKNSNKFKPEFIRFGNKSIKDDVPKTDVKIVSTIVHPQYDQSKKAFDIALLELEDDLILSEAVMPACLWSDPKTDTKQSGIAPAWSRSRHQAENDDVKIIKVMKGQAIDSETCLPLIKHFISRRFKYEDHHLCVDDSKSDIILCVGSSGAPLITQVALDGSSDLMPYAVGISSFGNSQCTHDINIFMRISSFIDWIESVAWPQSPK